MVNLTIYIPTYNRLEKLKNCLKCIKYDIKGYEDKVCVYVSNNGSTDGTKEYLDSLGWVKKRHNEVNLGAAKNFIHAYDLPFESKFVWIIGDDDYVIPGTIGDLLKKTKYDVDFIFCNTMAFSPEDEQRIWESYPVFAAGDVLGAADMNAVGLWRVTTCTVSSAGGTAATASNGVITIGFNKRRLVKY